MSCTLHDVQLPQSASASTTASHCSTRSRVGGRSGAGLVKVGFLIPQHAARRVRRGGIRAGRGRCRPAHLGDVEQADRLVHRAPRAGRRGCARPGRARWSDRVGYSRFCPPCHKGHKRDRHAFSHARHETISRAIVCAAHGSPVAQPGMIAEKRPAPPPAVDDMNAVGLEFRQSTCRLTALGQTIGDTSLRRARARRPSSRCQLVELRLEQLGLRSSRPRERSRECSGDTIDHDGEGQHDLRRVASPSSWPRQRHLTRALTGSRASWSTMVRRPLAGEERHGVGPGLDGRNPKDKRLPGRTFLVLSEAETDLARIAEGRSIHFSRVARRRRFESSSWSARPIVRVGAIALAQHVLARSSSRSGCGSGRLPSRRVRPTWSSPSRPWILNSSVHAASTAANHDRAGIPACSLPSRR